VARPVKARVPAIAYLRTSSAANVGSDKDSDKRQREAIAAYARSAGLELVGEYYDAAVSGADPIDTRPGFRALLDRIVSNGVRTVIVEDASRFARTLMVQEAGIATLAGIGVQVLTSRGDDLTDSDDEMRVAMRQIAGVFSQLEKTRLVKKLATARARGRAAGRTPHVFASTFFVPPSRFFPSVSFNPNVVRDYSSNVGHRARVWARCAGPVNAGLSPPTSPAARLLCGQASTVNCDKSWRSSPPVS
jgi:DNA invertase Pin-like site-specific DNA recombinase